MLENLQKYYRKSDGVKEMNGRKGESFFAEASEDEVGEEKMK